jgi:cytochrome o ubiquinol oxidase operon protein cyoD
VFVVNELWPTQALVYIVLAIAVIQLVVQMVFFLHLGRGSRWKALTFYFTLLIVAIIVVGTIWIMNNLNYNMMRMSPDEMKDYMNKNQGI